MTLLVLLRLQKKEVGKEVSMMITLMAVKRMVKRMVIRMVIRIVIRIVIRNTRRRRKRKLKEIKEKRVQEQEYIEVLNGSIWENTSYDDSDHVRKTWRE